MFLLSVWSLVIVGLATLMEVRRLLPMSEALLYLLGLAGVCAVVYVVFSVSTLYYLGYPLLVAYVYFAVHRYVLHSQANYLCGHCGAKMHSKGRCPSCGTLND